MLWDNGVKQQIEGFVIVLVKSYQVMLIWGERNSFKNYFIKHNTQTFKEYLEICFTESFYLYSKWTMSKMG